MNLIRWWFVALLALLTSCAESACDEVVRVASPNKAVDAVVVESSEGATTSFRYDVCIIARGISCDPSNSAVTLYGASRNENSYGVNLHWLNNGNLNIEYLSATRVVVHSLNASFNGRQVKLNLQPGIIDPSAPPGGMEYNKKKRGVSIK